MAAAVGIGAIKYADLSTDMIKNYVFDIDRMLSFNGDTGVYLQFTHARLRSILRKARRSHGSAEINIGEPAERALAVQLLLFPDVIAAVADSLEVHKLTGYLRALAVAVTRVRRDVSGAAVVGARCGRAGSRCAPSPRGCWRRGSTCSASRRRSGCKAR